MITESSMRQAKRRAGDMIRKAGIRCSDQELDRMDVADFGLSNLFVEGAEILPLTETEKVACRIIALFPGQTEPEHWHEESKEIGKSGLIPGKEETLRVITGMLRVFVEGEQNTSESVIPEGKEAYYTCRHQILLEPCENLTLYPGMKHWFQAGEEGCVFYTISTTAKDGSDPFTDPSVVRKTQIIREK